MVKFSSCNTHNNIYHLHNAYIILFKPLFVQTIEVSICGQVQEENASNHYISSISTDVQLKPGTKVKYQASHVKPGTKIPGFTSHV